MDTATRRGHRRRLVEAVVVSVASSMLPGSTVGPSGIYLTDHANRVALSRGKGVASTSRLGIWPNAGAA
jgi:hypothetical protein